MTSVSDLIAAQCDYYLSPIEPLLRAWYIAEGGTPGTFIKAIQCSLPNCHTLDEALARGAKTIRSRIIAYCDFCEEDGQPLFVLVRREATDPWTSEANPRVLRFSDRFIRFCGATIAPVGADNDPTHLNENWTQNVQAIYADLIAKGPDVPPAGATYA